MAHETNDYENALINEMHRMLGDMTTEKQSRLENCY